MITCREAEIEDAVVFAPLLRPADALEVIRLGSTPEQALHDEIAGSESAAVFFDDDKPLCAFGVRPDSEGVGAVWMLGTDALRGHKKRFLIETRRWVQVLRESYTLLYACVDVEYHSAVRWLQWAGFRSVCIQHLGPDRSPFLRMEIDGVR